MYVCVSCGMRERESRAKARVGAPAGRECIPTMCTRTYIYICMVRPAIAQRYRLAGLGIPTAYRVRAAHLQVDIS